MKTQFVCSNCGHTDPKWLGRCPDCGEWSTFVEEMREDKKAVGFAAREANAKTPGRAAGVTLSLNEVRAEREGGRIGTGVGELNRVLGGGIVPGSLVLVGGEPGVGKSTLLLQVMGHLGEGCLMVSGEESTRQVALSARRLGVGDAGFRVLSETDVDVIEATILEERPKVVVVDSIQTLYSPELTGAPGGVGQVRETAARLMRLAKAEGIAVFLVGHVTKDGSIAGPRVLEHMVDTVLQFEGDRYQSFRVLRALKNRFGSTNEVGVFEMRQGGLVEVADASARFVGEATRAPGSVVLAAMEGSRPLLVEVQALVSPSEIVPPRRMCTGIDRNRLALVLAVLGRHAGIGAGTADVFVNVAGGVRIDEPGADLAVALAVASAVRGAPLGGEGGKPVACFGEVGLTGELRSVGHADRRLAEARKFGLDPVVSPEAGTLRAAIRQVLPKAAAWPREAAAA